MELSVIVVIVVAFVITFVTVIASFLILDSTKDVKNSVDATNDILKEQAKEEEEEDELARIKLILPATQSFLSGSTVYPSIVDDVYKIKATSNFSLDMQNYNVVTPAFFTLMLDEFRFMLYNNTDYSVTTLDPMYQIPPAYPVMHPIGGAVASTVNSIITIGGTHTLRGFVQPGSNTIFRMETKVIGADDDDVFGAVALDTFASAALGGVVDHLTLVRKSTHQFCAMVGASGQNGLYYNVVIDPITFAITTNSTVVLPGITDVRRYGINAGTGTQFLVMTNDAVLHMVLINLPVNGDAPTVDGAGYTGVGDQSESIVNLVRKDNGDVYLVSQSRTKVVFLEIAITINVITLESENAPQLTVPFTEGIAGVISNGNGLVLAPCMPTMGLYNWTSGPTFNRVAHPYVYLQLSEVNDIQLVRIDKWRVMFSAYDVTTNLYICNVIDMSAILPEMNFFLTHDVAEGVEEEVKFNYPNVVTDVTNTELQFPLSNATNYIIASTEFIFTPNLTQEISFKK